VVARQSALILGKLVHNVWVLNMFSAQRNPKKVEYKSIAEKYLLSKVLETFTTEIILII